MKWRIAATVMNKQVPPFQASLSLDSLEANGGAADIAEIERIVKEKIVRFKPLVGFSVDSQHAPSRARELFFSIGLV